MPTPRTQGRDWINNGPIHHEKITAELVTDQEADAGVGAFDVIEEDEGFCVVDSVGGYDGLYDTLEEAREAAQAEADAFDAERRAAGSYWREPETN